MVLAHLGMHRAGVDRARARGLVSDRRLPLRRQPASCTSPGRPRTSLCSRRCRSTPACPSCSSTCGDCAVTVIPQTGSFNWTESPVAGARLPSRSSSYQRRSAWRGHRFGLGASTATPGRRSWRRAAFDRLGDSSAEQQAAPAAGAAMVRVAVCRHMAGVRCLLVLFQGLLQAATFTASLELKLRTRPQSQGHSRYMRSSPTSQSLTIGRLARAADVGVETIRYYQDRKLLPVPRERRGVPLLPDGPDRANPLHQAGPGARLFARRSSRAAAARGWCRSRVDSASGRRQAFRRSRRSWRISSECSASSKTC